MRSAQSGTVRQTFGTTTSFALSRTTLGKRDVQHGGIRTQENTMLAAFDAQGRFYKGNIHGHSNRSDGAISPEDVCQRYKAAGYDFIALTDHFLPAFDYPITDTRAFRDSEFTTILGAEVHAPSTELGEMWHILAVGLPDDFAKTGSDETGVALAQRCAQAGAFVAIAHPQWYQLSVADGLSLDAAHAIEMYNHTSLVNADRGDGAELCDALLNEGKRLGCIAVDDSHWKSDDAFGGWVMVKATENTDTALIAALKAGQYYATQGPEIFNIAHEGDEIVVECSSAVSIMLLGKASANVCVHGQDLTGTRLTLSKFDGGWCRLVIIDKDGKRAWSNPLWL
jgi:hypothetical protein